MNKLYILFVLDKTKLNNKMTCPIKCRLTYNSKRKIFSTGVFINPDHWNSKKQKALLPNEENDFINSQLSLISQKINKAFLMLQIQELEFDVEDIYLTYKGETTKNNKSFLEVMQLHNDRMDKLVYLEEYPNHTIIQYDLRELSVYLIWKYPNTTYILYGNSVTLEELYRNVLIEIS